MNKLEYPVISIAIATFNSERTLEKTLLSIKKQDYPQNKIEILIIDGGSIDKTREIAKKYGCIILHEPKKELINRKQMGLLNASGKFLVYLDSDESLENTKSLRVKYEIFLKNRLVKAVRSEGFKSPSQTSFINHYLNEFGDPFTFYLYRESYSYKFFIKEWKEKYKVLEENSEYVIFDLYKHNSSLIEFWAAGNMVDLEYVRSAFPLVSQDPALVPLLFYLLIGKGKLLAIMKNDVIIHDSSATLNKYLKKILARIKSNLFQTDLGKGGFSGRERFQSRSYLIKKFFFPIYAFSILLPLIDSIYLSTSRKRLSYLIHLPLSIYTAVFIVYFMILKIIGLRPKMGTYGS